MNGLYFRKSMKMSEVKLMDTVSKHFPVGH